MVCDKDCFNCPFDDCIREEGRDEAERKAIYRRKYPERVRESRRKQYIKNREREIEYSRTYYKNIKNSERYAEYKAERSQYMREYRARMKAEG